MGGEVHVVGAVRLWITMMVMMVMKIMMVMMVMMFVCGSP
jgi:hypothetical protein